ncbi:MFS general substrate transporter [Aureobasidium sp. EXF-10727]|nr:MFS general substrate transporter [Aureobasidium sp. EXF-10727]
MIARQEEESDAQVASKDVAQQETTPLLEQEVDAENSQRQEVSQHDEQPRRSVCGIISVLLIGVFVSQADTTLVFATYAHITSEFIRLGGGSWIDGSWIEPHQHTDLKQSIWTKLRRIDFVGAFFMSIAILASITAFDLGSKKASTPVLTILVAVAVTAGVLFALTEKLWAKEPIFPLELLGKDAVITSYSIISIQTGIQVALMFLVPLYFQVTANASMGQAGAHLVPAVFGNTLGGLAVGAWIKRTGRYKPPTVLASLSAMLCFSLLLIFWRGHTSTAASLVIFFGGCASGMANSAVFVGLTAGVEKEQVAIATTGLYLSANISVVAGVSAASAIFQSALRANLHRILGRVVGGDEIAKKVLSDVARADRFGKYGTGHRHLIKAKENNSMSLIKLLEKFDLSTKST